MTFIPGQTVRRHWLIYKNVDAQTTLTENFKNTTRHVGTSAELVQTVSVWRFSLAHIIFWETFLVSGIVVAMPILQFGIGFMCFMLSRHFSFLVFRSVNSKLYCVSTEELVAMIQVYQQDRNSREFHLDLCRPLVHVETSTDYCIQ